MRPFRTATILKDKVWAGGRLPAWLPQATPETGEAWLVSDVEGDASPVLGEHAGATLRDLCRDHAEALLGPEQTKGARFPVLIKLLDIGPSPLSVQLHPDGPTARALGHGERGKCEAWLVLERQDAQVWLGVDPPAPAARLLEAARSGSLQDLLATWVPEPGEGFPILPGTLHTARGLVALEVQETSDITYRVFDYGRGRELHLEAAREVLERLGPQAPPARDPDPGWRDGARTIAPGCPFAFQAVQLDRSGRWAPEEASPGPKVVVGLGPTPLSLQTDGNPALELGVGEAAVLPACAPPAVLRGAPGVRAGWAAST